ncbi:MAG: hypothetical protein ACT4P7_20130 [Gemmatimonadaceae bacterium]
MAIFNDSGIRFNYTLTSQVDGPPQPTIEEGKVLLETGSSVFRATVTATALDGNAALVNNLWRAGFIQEIHASSRVGHYHKDVRTEDRLWGVPARPGEAGRSIRDSRGGELPYDGHSADLTMGIPVSIESDDAPKLELPLDLVIDGAGRALTNVTGGDRFTIWLAATRDSAPQRLVILGRINWLVNWRAVVTSGRNTAMTPLLQPVVHEAPELHIAQGFSPGAPLGPGYPQDLTDIEGNDFFYRVTYLRGVEVHRGEIDSDPTEPSAALAKFPKKINKAKSWW